MTELTIFGPTASSYLRTVRMICAEKGVSYRVEPLELGSDAHRAMHPWAKVPIIEHEGVQVFETSAIARYIDEAFDGPSLRPADVTQRAVMDQWISVLDCYLYDDLVRNYVLQYLFPRSADGKPNREIIDKAAQASRRDLAELNKALDGRPFIAGTLSLADLFYPGSLQLLAVPGGEGRAGREPQRRGAPHPDDGAPELP